MRADKIREQDTAELKRQAADAVDQMFRLKFQIGMGQTDGIKKYRQLRRDRARILTVLHEREREGAAPQPAAQPEKKKGKK